MRRVLLALLLTIVAAARASAQEQLPIGTRVGNDVPRSGYDDGGRRDPFVSGIAPKKAAATSAARPKAGLAGIAVADVSVKGIIANGANVAVVLEGAGKSFVAHRRDLLQDGVVKSIDPAGVVFTVQVVDAAGVTHARDVRKAIRSVAEAAQ